MNLFLRFKLGCISVIVFSSLMHVFPADFEPILIEWTKHSQTIPANSKSRPLADLKFMQKAFSKLATSEAISLSEDASFSLHPASFKEAFATYLVHSAAQNGEKQLVIEILLHRESSSVLHDPLLWFLMKEFPGDWFSICQEIHSKSPEMKVRNMIMEELWSVWPTALGSKPDATFQFLKFRMESINGVFLPTSGAIEPSISSKRLLLALEVLKINDYTVATCPLALALEKLEKIIAEWPQAKGLIQKVVIKCDPKIAEKKITVSLGPNSLHTILSAISEQVGVSFFVCDSAVGPEVILRRLPTEK